MNKVFKVIWSEARNAYVVVSEIAKNHGSKSCSTKKLLAMLIATGVMTCASMAPAMAADPPAEALKHSTVTAGYNITVTPKDNSDGGKEYNVDLKNDIYLAGDDPDALVGISGRKGTIWATGSVTVGSGVDGSVVMDGTTATVSGLGNKTTAYAGFANGKGKAATEEQLKEISEVAENANQGWNLSTNGDAASKVAPGETVDFSGDQNINISNDGTKVKVELKNDIYLAGDDADAFVNISGSKGTIWASGSVTAGSVVASDNDGNYSEITPKSAKLGQVTIDEKGNIAGANHIQTNALNAKYNLSVGTANENGTVPFFVNSNGSFYAANGKLVVDKDGKLVAPEAELGKVTADEGEIGNVVLKDGVFYKNTALRDGELYVGDADGNYSQITPKSAKLGQVTIDEKGNIAGVNSVQTNALNAKYNLSVGTVNENGTVPFFVNSNGAFYAANGKLVVDKDGKLVAPEAELGKVTADEGEIGNVVLKDGVFYKNTALRDGELYVGDADGNYSQITPKSAKLGQVTIDEKGNIAGVNSVQTNALNAKYNLSVGTVNENGTVPFFVNSNGSFYAANGKLVVDKDGKLVAPEAELGKVTADEGEIGNVVLKDGVFYKNTALRDGEMFVGDASGNYSQITPKSAKLGQVTIDEKGNIAGVNSIQTNALNAKYNLSVGTANENGTVPFFVNSNGSFYAANGKLVVDKDGKLVAPEAELGKVTADEGEIGNVVLKDGVFYKHSALRDGELFVGDASGSYSQITTKGAKLGKVTVAEDGKISGVAAGAITADSTDAVNGSQLHAVATEAGKHSKVVNGSNTNVEETTVDGQKVYKVNLNNNIMVGDITGKYVSISGTNGTIEATGAIATKDRVYADKGAKLADIDVNGDKISNGASSIVLDGSNVKVNDKVTIDQNGNIAGVNSLQTNALNAKYNLSVGTANENGTVPFFVNSNGAFYAANGKLVVDKDGKLVAPEAELGKVTADEGEIGNVVLKDGVFYKHTALRDGELFVGDASGNYSQITTKGAKLGKVTVAEDGKISGVAAGAVTADSTDAVNGSQLHAVATEAGKHSKVVNGSNINVEETDVDGQKIYKVNLNKDIMLGDLTGKYVNISGTNGTIETTGYIATKDRVYADKGAKLADIDVTGNKISNGASSIVLDGSNVKVNDKVTIDQNGNIAGVNSLQTNALNAKYNLSVGTANENGIMPFFVNSNGAFYGANNNFSVDKDGKVTATAGEIGNVVLKDGVFYKHSALRDGELFVGDASGNYSQITTKGAKLGKVTVAEDGKISGVAAGAVTADSTDAVNGSQLHAVATEAGKHSKVVNGSNINVEETDVDGQKIYKVNLNKDIMLGDLTGKYVNISGTNGTIETTGYIATKDRVYADKGAKLADIDVTGNKISNGASSIVLDGSNVKVNDKVTIDQNGNIAGVNSLQTNALNAKYNLSVGTANENGIMPFFVNSNGAFYGANNNFSVDKDGKVTATAGEIGNVVLKDGVFYKHSALRDGELFVGDASGNYSQITTKGAKLGKVTVAEDGKISGVAAGAVTADSTDAVNGSQLHAVATEAGKHSKVVNGSNINVEETDVDGQKIYKVNLNKDIMLGDLTGKYVNISGTNGTIETTGYIATKDRVYADKGAKLADIDVTGDTISNGDAKLALNGAAGTAGMINGKGASVYMQDGYTVINSKVAFDQNGKISGVAAGAVTADSTDAVNGSQLHAVATEAGKHSKVVSGNNINVEETDVDGQKFYKVNMNKDIILGDLTGKYVNISGTNGTIEATGAIATKDRVYADKGAKLADIDVTGNKISNGASSIVLDGSNVKVNDKVTIDQNGKISGVAAGEISDTSTDAINGSQLKETNDRVAANETAIKNNTEAISKLDGRVTANETAIKNNTEAIGNLNTRVDGVEKLAKQHTTVTAGDNVTVTEDTNKDGGKEYKVALKKDINLDSVTTGQTVMNKDGLKVGDKVSVTATAVTAGKTSISDEGVKVGDKTYISDKGLNANDQKVTNVAAGEISATSKDAVNGSQLYATNQEVANNTNRINQLGSRVNKVGAGAAALAALHPMDFDPDDKLTFSAGYGNYGGENAAAIGAYYRPDEKVMFSVGGTVGNGENMVNAGVSFSLDRTNHVSNSRTAMAREILDLRAEVTELKAMVAKGGLGSIAEDKMKIFPDVAENHWAYEYVGKLAAAGIIEGYPDGNFSGDRMMSRYEFAAMLYRAMQKGAQLDSKIIKEFAPEMGRIRVDRISGEDGDRDKIERVRVNAVKGERDHYGNKIAKAEAKAK